ncbi:stalk domain-containing protein [Paenibacillus sp.]|jgi:hypothetical protein|uniref:stalk domain-containing protein n=1 Tax=Paenibacillus sp. TaxID=58172 RepID=UPI0028218B74|nr:stalk domain-containing protein [Paenibacillus sp.]MDR0268483.1 copper amine oxidase N-terminal domain-containing protein [Paenibacillus sp.]
MSINGFLRKRIMNSKSIVAAAGALLLVVSFSGISYASGTPAGVILNGVQYPLEQMPATIDKGITWVPLRFVSEKIGAKLNWDPQTQKIEILKGENRISLTVGSTTALVNGESVQLSSPVMQQEGITMVPLRFVSEQLSAEVQWDSILGVVKIHMPDKDLGEVDPFGRKIRTTNLPKNASDYPYIIEGLPNEMYEMPHRNITGSAESAATFSSELNKPLLERYISMVEQYGNLLLNVDYKVIDQSWVENYMKLFNQYTNNATYAKKYVKSVKENHIQVEGTLIPEPSMVFYSDAEVIVRCQFAFRIKGSDTDKEIIYDPYFRQTKFQKNIWYVGYTDIGLSSNVFNGTLRNFKISPTATFFRDYAVHVLK